MTSTARTWCAVALAAGLCLVAVIDGIVGSGTLVDHSLTWVVAAATGFALGAWAPVRHAIVGVLAADAALTFANQRHFPEEYPLVDDLVFGLLVVGAPALIGAMVVARRTQVRELAASSEQLTRRRAAELAAARLEEQQRIQGAVHQRLVERMGAIALRAEGAGRESEPTRRDEAIGEVERAARAGLDELRQALGVLRTAPEPVVPDTDQSPPPPPEHSWRPDVGLAALVAVPLAIESVVSPDATGPATLNVLASLVTALPLVWRRRHPVAVAMVSLVAAGASSTTLTPAATMVTSLALLLLLGYSIGAHTSGWRRVTGSGTLVAGLAGLTLVTPGGGSTTDLGPAVVWCLLSIAAGALVAGWSSRARQLGEVVDALERSRDADLRVAVARRREEMSRDLHDSVAHTLTAICLGAGAARRGGSPGEALTTIAGVARQGMGELRRGLDAMEPSATGDAALGMASALGIRLTLEAHDVGAPLDHPLLHRVLREALVNAARHAPGSPVDARFDRVGDDVRLTVTDEGATSPSTDPHGSGSGLAGLNELLREQGGTLQYGRHPGGGFRLRATVPVAAPAAAEATR